MMSLIVDLAQFELANDEETFIENSKKQKDYLSIKHRSRKIEGKPL